MKLLAITYVKAQQIRDVLEQHGESELVAWFDEQLDPQGASTPLHVDTRPGPSETMRDEVVGLGDRVRQF